MEASLKGDGLVFQGVWPVAVRCSRTAITGAALLVCEGQELAEAGLLWIDGRIFVAVAGDGGKNLRALRRRDVDLCEECARDADAFGVVVVVVHAAANVVEHGCEKDGVLAEGTLVFDHEDPEQTRDVADVVEAVTAETAILLALCDGADGALVVGMGEQAIWCVHWRIRLSTVARSSA